MSADPLELSTPRAYALAYARMGWFVFPVEPQSKVPLGKLVPRGMLDATTDEETIVRWWRMQPLAGIGIALHPSGLVALDIDPRNGGDETFEQLQRDHGNLRSDVMALTGGGGEHHIFVIPPGVQVSLPGTLGPGVDVKANGYIVVEPSVHPNGKRYVWEASSSPFDGIAPSPLPDWLRGAFKGHAKPQEAQKTTSGRVREGGRNNYLSKRAYGLKRAGIPHSLLYQALTAINDAECDPPLEASEVRSIADGKRIIGAEDVPDDAQDDAAPTWMDDVPPPDWSEDAPEIDIPIRTLAQLKEQAGSVTWLVKGLIQCDTVGMVFGGGGSFKSFVCLDMALHIAHGLAWCGRRTKQGPVVFIAAEGGAGLWRRIDAWHRMHGMVWEKISDLFLVIPAALDLNATASAVKDAVNALGVRPVLVTIDTMSQTYRGEENSANEVAHYLANLGLMFRTVWQCAVVIIHHTGHAATERPRGSTAMSNNVDFMFGCFRDAQEMLATLENVRQKDGERAEEVTFSLTPVELDKDDDGDKVTSLVAAMVRSTEEMLEIMHAEAAKGHKKGRNALLLSIAKDGQSEKDLRSAFYEASELDDPNSRRQAFHRAMDWARKTGLLLSDKGTIKVLRRIEP